MNSQIAEEIAEVLTLVIILWILQTAPLSARTKNELTRVLLVNPRKKEFQKNKNIFFARGLRSSGNYVGIVNHGRKQARFNCVKPSG